MPKPHTPFQWLGQAPHRGDRRKAGLSRHGDSEERGISLKPHDPETSLLEGAFARGDRALGRVIEEAVRLGCRFDGWTECFDFKKWTEAFQDCGLDLGCVREPDLRPRRAASLGLRADRRDEGIPEAGIRAGDARQRSRRTAATECEPLRHRHARTAAGRPFGKPARAIAATKPIQAGRNSRHPSGETTGHPHQDALYQDRQAPLPVPPRLHDALPARRRPGRISRSPFPRASIRIPRSPSARRSPWAWRARPSTSTWRPMPSSTCSARRRR